MSNAPFLHRSTLDCFCDIQAIKQKKIKQLLKEYQTVMENYFLLSGQASKLLAISCKELFLNTHFTDDEKKTSPHSCRNDRTNLKNKESWYDNYGQDERIS